MEIRLNDQFDRLSAPIESRYTRDEVEGVVRRAGLEETVVFTFVIGHYAPAHF